ncbi:MAG: putative DNA modification/repair radical SAM protein [Polyangiales bacterium]
MAEKTLKRRLEILAEAARYDASCASSGARRKGEAGALGNATGVGICHSYTPDGRCVSLLKLLLTNHCVYDCQYCVNRATSPVERASFTPAEVVWLTTEFYRRNYIEGLFLSSGVVKSADHTMGELVAVARALRTEHRFGGYIHLKAVPGASPELLTEAGRWADRLSANIELPTATDLARLAPGKSFSVVESAMGVIAERRAEAVEAKAKRARAPVFAPAGQSTQMIVGATPATDAEVLSTAARLYRAHDLRRVYYSAYSPTPHADGRLPPEPPPLLREHRLYQSDWLFRHYGFEPEEITPPEAPQLDLSVDPKLAWALRHRERFPVDVNTAPREMLLRVPGLGVRNVDRIVQARRFRAVTLADLARLKLPMQKVRPFVLTADHNPAPRALDRLDLRQRVTRGAQLDLFAPRDRAL